MRKKILGLAMLISVVSAFAVFMPSASAAVKSGQCLGYGSYSSLTGWQYQSNATWSFDTATGVLTIGGTGNASFEKLPDGYDDSVMPDYYLHLDFDMEDVTSLVIGDGITELRGFNDLINVKTFPSFKNVTNIGQDSFNSCGFESVVIPDCVTNIGNMTFHCGDMKEVTFSKNMSAIPYESFYSLIQKITIPVSIKEIMFSAFLSDSTGIPPVRDVYYGGTKAQWNSVKGKDNDGLKAAVIHCTDGDIASAVVPAPDYYMYTVSGSTTIFHVPVEVTVVAKTSYEVEVQVIRGNDTFSNKVKASITPGTNIVDVGVPIALLIGDRVKINIKPII